MTSARISLGLALIMALSLVTMIPLGGATSTNSSVTTIDESHGLTDDSAIEAFEESGTASTDLTQLGMSLTVAEHSSDVGVDSYLETDFNAVYLRAEYDETIERSVRVYIPNEYWHPYPSQAEQAIQGDAEADFEPVQDGEYTAVTIHFDGEDDAVFRLSKEAATVFQLRDSGATTVENVTGYELPTVVASTEWQYAQDAFAGNDSTVAFEHVNESLVLEYDSDETPSRERWVNVPSCDSTAGSEAPVCEYQRQGVENTTYVLARTNDPPALRFTDDRSWIDGFRATVINDLRSALDDLQDRLEEIRPGMAPSISAEVTPW